MQNKTCKRCGRTLPIESFTMDKSTKDGRCFYCRDCISKKNKEDRAKRQQRVATVAMKKQPTPTYRNKNTHCVIGDCAPNPLLSDFTPRELLSELKARGYEGEVKYIEVRTIKL